MSSNMSSTLSKAEQERRNVYIQHKNNFIVPYQPDAEISCAEGKKRVQMHQFCIKNTLIVVALAKDMEKAFAEGRLPCVIMDNFTQKEVELLGSFLYSQDYQETVYDFRSYRSEVRLHVAAWRLGNTWSIPSLCEKAKAHFLQALGEINSVCKSMFDFGDVRLGKRGSDKSGESLSRLGKELLDLPNEGVALLDAFVDHCLLLVDQLMEHIVVKKLLLNELSGIGTRLFIQSCCDGQDVKEPTSVDSKVICPEHPLLPAKRSYLKSTCAECFEVKKKEESK